MNEPMVRPVTLFGRGTIEFAELLKGDIFYFNDDVNNCYFVIGNNEEVIRGGIITIRTEVIKISGEENRYFVKSKYVDQIKELNKFYQIDFYTTNEDQDELKVQIIFERKNDV